MMMNKYVFRGTSQAFLIKLRLIIGLMLAFLLTACVLPPIPPLETTRTVPTTTIMPQSTQTPTASTTPLASSENADVSEEIQLDQITFGSPYVIISNTYNLQIVDWLNVDTLLLVRELEPAGNNAAIEVVNIQTHEIQRVAEGHLVQLPVWLPATRQVAYVVNSSYKVEGLPWRDLWISSVDVPNPELWRENVGLPIIATGTATTVTIATREMRSWENVTLQKPQVTQVLDLDFSEFAPPIPTPMEWIYHTAYNQQTSWVAMYNKGHFLLFDPQIESIQEIDLGQANAESRWALHAQWDPTGDVLAINVTIGRLPNTWRSLLLYNVTTQELKPLNLLPGFVLSNIAWSPDARFLLLQGSEGYTDAGYSLLGNVLVDVQTAQAQPVNIVPPATLGGATSYALTWSPDGQKVLLTCMNPKQDKMILYASEVTIP